MNCLIQRHKMSAKIYWNLLVLFGVLCQGISSTLSEKDIDESSELLIRQKRVINSAPDGDRREPIRDFPYIVSLKLTRISASFCAGVILKPSIVLTASQCVSNNDLTLYRVYSGHGKLLSAGGTTVVHNVTEKRICLGNFPYRPVDGIALLTVYPSFIYSINTHSISFYQGPIEPGSHGVVKGWGCNPTRPYGTAHPQFLRSITVPIISNEECAAIYRQTHFPVSANDICTWDRSGQQYCSVNDAGDPLVIQVDYESYLLGIHLHNKARTGRSYPDVFANLQASKYKSFILENIDSM